MNTTIPLEEAVEAGIRDWLLRSGYDPDDPEEDDSGDLAAMRDDMRGFLTAAYPHIVREVKRQILKKIDHRRNQISLVNMSDYATGWYDAALTISSLIEEHS